MVRRKGETVKASRSDEPEDCDDGFDNLDEEDDSQYKPKPSKRRRTSNKGDNETGKATQRRKGKLRNLVQMPLDILFEIFGCLAPLDVLRLARTSKDLRSVLMKRSAMSLWKTSFTNVPGTPTVPEGMSEPAWANFLFTNHCFVCLSPRPSHTLAAHCLRYCKRCIVDKVYFDPGSSKEIQTKLEAWSLTEFDGYDFIYTYTPTTSGRSKWTEAWLRTDIQEFEQGLGRVIGNERQHQRFLEDCAAYLEILQERVESYYLWMKNKAIDRSVEFDRICEVRYNSVLQRLCDAGWKYELDRLTVSQKLVLRSLCLDSNYKNPKPLTTRTFNKIEPILVEQMERFREERLAEERSKVLEVRYNAFIRAVKNHTTDHPSDSVLPSATDLYFLPSFGPLNKVIQDTPNEEALPPSLFDDFLAQMPNHCDAWEAACAAEVKNHIQPSSPSQDLPYLARIAFQCASCSSTITFPSMLGHRCFKREPEYCRFSKGLKQIGRWPVVAFGKLDMLMPRPVGSIIEACGFDPDTATQAELDAANVWIATGRGSQTVMHWRKALGTIRPSHGFVVSLSWSKVTDVALIEAYDHAELDFYRKQDSRCTVICTHCSNRIPSFDLDAHVKGHVPKKALQRSDFVVPPETPVLELFSMVVDPETGLERVPPVASEPGTTEVRY
ncbi:hypothetical protein ONZ45_g2661 [Pleurotus djamor]|nr:hypothetical protein ONZ45_g2661 [Pleurotus djamor]